MCALLDVKQTIGQDGGSIIYMMTRETESKREQSRMGEDEMMPQVIRLLSSILERVAKSNDDIISDTDSRAHVSVFHGLSRPTISVHAYLSRIFKYANCSPSCYIVAYVYLARFTHRLPINSFNLHRLLLTTVMLSAKFMDDIYYNNAYYAKVGGISTAEMNFLEVDFLFGLGFHLNVTPSTFQTYCSYLQREMMLLHPHLNISEEYSLYTSSNLYSYFSEDEQPQQQQQQLAV